MMIEQVLVLVDKLMARGVPANVAAMAASNTFIQSWATAGRGRVIGEDELLLSAMQGGAK